MRLAAALESRLATALRTKVMTIRTERPIVCFTFDDAPRSAASVGAKVLEAAGALGTFYVACGLCGGEEEGTPILTGEDLVGLNEGGHELACHTFSHRRVSSMSSAELRSEVERNQTFVSGLCGDVRLRNFSYPFGDVTPGRKFQAQSMFATARGISPGVNSGTADLGLLKAVALYGDRRDDRAVEGWLDRVEREKGWLIFYTHDVGSSPSPWGATTQQLEAVVGSVRARGYEILTVRNALGRLAPAGLR
ncbi:MAG TPA: polysaccharide deacetylase family protein [Caulobacteraceae bacterium]|nr:polysaccharide deacetylase family protein [Caulobacteraceae bacterium]